VLVANYEVLVAKYEMLVVFTKIFIKNNHTSYINYINHINHNSDSGKSPFIQPLNDVLSLSRFICKNTRNDFYSKFSNEKNATFAT
jgi:hypothetical protein